MTITVSPLFIFLLGAIVGSLIMFMIVMLIGANAKLNKKE